MTGAWGTTKTQIINTITMKKEYKSPVVEQVPLMVEQPICSASTSFGGGDYDLFPDDFDSDSD